MELRTDNNLFELNLFINSNDKNPKHIYNYLYAYLFEEYKERYVIKTIRELFNKEILTLNKELKLELENLNKIKKDYHTDDDNLIQFYDMSIATSYKEKLEEIEQKREFIEKIEKMNIEEYILENYNFKKYINDKSKKEENKNKINEISTLILNIVSQKNKNLNNDLFTNDSLYNISLKIKPKDLKILGFINERNNNLEKYNYQIHEAKNVLNNYKKIHEQVIRECFKKLFKKNSKKIVDLVIENEKCKRIYKTLLNEKLIHRDSVYNITVNQNVINKKNINKIPFKLYNLLERQLKNQKIYYPTKDSEDESYNLPSKIIEELIYEVENKTNYTEIKEVSEKDIIYKHTYNKNVEYLESKILKINKKIFHEKNKIKENMQCLSEDLQGVINSDINIGIEEITSNIIYDMSLINILYVVRVIYEIKKGIITDNDIFELIEKNNQNLYSNLKKDLENKFNLLKNEIHGDYFNVLEKKKEDKHV